MKKLLATAFLTAAALSASAQTVVNLGDIRCQSAVMCQSIPNDSASTISVMAGAGNWYGFVYVTGPDGTMDVYTVATPINWAAFSATDADGVQVTGSIAWRHYTICGGSGRGGGYCHPQLELLSGTLSFYP